MEAKVTVRGVSATYVDHIKEIESVLWWCKGNEAFVTFELENDNEVTFPTRSVIRVDEIKG